MFRLPEGMTEDKVAETLGLTLTYRELVMYLKDAAGVVAGHVQSLGTRPGTLWLFPTYGGYEQLREKVICFATEAA